MDTTGRASKSDDESDSVQYELTDVDEDAEEEEEEEAEAEAEEAQESECGKEEATRRDANSTRKRKRSNDDEELARRRRRRRSLAFHPKKRRSLTAAERKTAAGSEAGSAGTATTKATAVVTHSKQYISDMYSTIIKMSSENKINVKNSWSLHLIDHMEDILDSSKKNAAGGQDNTYNFQRASCTLDASIKIYSYRVDDTWNSSYKILENLSRTEHKHGVDDAGSDAEGNARTARKTRKTHARTIEKNLNNINLKAYDTECEADPLFHKMSQSFDEGGAKGMLLANLSVYDGCKILLNSSDVSVVTRKPIHEDGAKSKDKAESPENQETKDSATCKASDCAAQSEPLHDKDVVQAEGIGENEQKVEEAKKEEEHGVEATDEDKDSKQAMDSEATDNSEGLDKDVAMEEERKNGEKDGLAEDVDMEECVDETPTASSDVTTEETHSKENDEPTEESAVESMSVVGDQSPSSVTATKEKESSDSLGVTKERISLSLFSSLSCIDQDVQNLSVCPPLYRMYDQLDEFYGDESRHRLGLKNNFLHTTPVKGQRQTLDKKDAVAVNLAGIMESASEDEPDGEDAVLDASMDFGDENTDHNDVGEDGDIIVDEVENVVEVICVDDVATEEENNIIDLAGSGDEDAVVEDLTHESAENDPIALDKELSLRSSAADFFRARVNENMPEDYENNLFSQMIESALVRSVTQDDDEQGVEDQDGRHDYSYFDAKMLRNWAGPGHWKFPAIRKIQMKQRCKEETDKDGLAGMNMEFDEAGAMIKAEPTELSADRARKGCSAGTATKTAITVDFFGEAPDFSKLRAPKSASSLEVSKGTLRKQVENASDLVLPVDTHIKVSLFFRHFLKERPRFFRKRSTHPLDGPHRESISANDCDFGGDSLDMDGDGDRKPVFTYNEDSAGFEGGYDDDDDDDEGIGSADDPATQSLYSAEGLVQADRVVQKIGVHYERFAKRVDVKKLKGSIWEHLEKQVVKDVGGEGADAGTAADTDVVSVNESGKRVLDTTEVCEQDESEGSETTFKSVVEHVATKVPSNVTVSFYFICVLHLANEKGLELAGQDDLRNFRIRKEDA